MRASTIFNALTAFAVLAFMLPHVAQAGDGEIAFSGRVAGGSVTVKQADLLAMEQTAFETDNPWTGGVTAFSGPTIESVLNAVKADGQTLKATALDDYSVSIPVNFLIQNKAIFAVSMNGKTLPLTEDFGPAWIMVNWDAHPDVNKEEFHAYGIWSLKSVTVE